MTMNNGDLPLDKQNQNILGDAEKLLLSTSQNTKRKILVSINLSVSIPVALYFFSRIFGPGLPNPERDAILYPLVMLINLASAVYGLYHLYKAKSGTTVIDVVFAWMSFLILQLVAVAFVNFTTVPTNSFLMINALPLIAIVFSGLVINRWVGVASFVIAVGNTWFAAWRIGFDYVYQVPNLFNIASQPPVIPVPISLYMVLWHLVFIMTILTIFFESGTIGRIISAIPEVVQKIRAAGKLQQELEMENMRMATELDVAKRLQMMVLPGIIESETIKELEIAGKMDPASEVGGDYYDYILKDDGVYFSIGDVTGHGLSSGVVMLMAQSSFTMALRSRDHDLPVIMEKMNKVLYSNIRYRMKEETNMTMAVVRYHEGKLDICGQHEHVLIARNDGTMETINTLDLGIYIGLDDDINHLFHVMNTRMDAGDTVLLYTDGATEAENDKHEEFGLERLKESFARHSKKNLQAVLESIRGEVYDWIGKSEVYDDITLLLFRRR